MNKLIYECPATAHQTRILWSERSFVYLTTDSLENLSVCMLLLRWRIYPLNVLIGESQERRITIYDSPSLTFSLLSQSPALFLAKTTAEQCYNYSFVLIPYCSFSSLQRLSRPYDIRYVCMYVWVTYVFGKGKVCRTCLGEKHREVRFTAKNPNRELWRL